MKTCGEMAKARGKRRLVSSMVVFAGIVLLISSPSAAELEKVNAAYSSPSGVFTPFWIQKEKGLDRKYGLEENLIYVAGGSKVAQVVMSGDLQFAGMGGGLVEAGLEGADLIFVATPIDTFIFSLYSHPSIRTVADLKGKIVGATRVATATWYAAMEAMSRYGFEAQKDYKLIQTGGVPETLASIEGGKVHAGIVSPPTTLKARKAGLRELVDLADLKIPFVQSGVVVRRSYMKNHEKTVEAFLKGIVEAIKAIKTEKEYTKTIVGKYTRTTNPEVLEETYNAFAARFPANPLPSRTAIQRLVDVAASVNPKARSARAEEFFDSRILENLEKSGFIRSLYQ